MDKRLHYYNLPLNIASFIQHKEADKQLEDNEYKPIEKKAKVSLEESIKLNIQLLLRTKLKDCRFDPEFGYVGWSKDFENITNESNWEKLIKEDFIQKVREYERRLVDVKVVIDLKKTSSNKQLTLNHQFVVRIEAKLKNTAERFEFEEIMYFSPIRVSSKF